MSFIRWVPLESNPEVMNKFLENLGVPSKWVISDVISLDEELLSMIPTPTLAFILLFPTTISDIHGKMKEEEAKAKDPPTKQPYFMKQTIKNACGTVALIHALANNVDNLNLDENSSLLKFINSTKDLSPEERGKHLETDDDIGCAHESWSQQGQTEAPSADADINLHFVAFVNVDGILYELDGRKEIPIPRGSTSSETFAKDTVKICKEIMARDPDNLNFTVLALGPVPDL